MTIPDLGSDLLSVAARTAIVYVCLVLLFRITGKREAGQLSTLDLVVLLVVANAVQNAMVGENTSLIGGLIAAAVIMGLDRGLHALTNRSRALREAIEGEPTILVDEGRIVGEALRREGISERELAIALRQNGLLTAEEARFVFLETNGMISVIPGRGGMEDAADERGPDAEGSIAGAVDGRPRARRRRPGKLSGTSR